MSYKNMIKSMFNTVKQDIRVGTEFHLNELGPSICLHFKWYLEANLGFTKCWFYIIAVIYLLRVNNENTRILCEICSKSTIKSPKQRVVVLVSLLFALNRLYKIFWSFCCWLWTSTCRSWWCRKLLPKYI